MEECFTDHECDNKRLNRNTKPTGICERRWDEARKCYITTVPILTCEGLWTRCQREAEDWIAPGGQLIASGVERNRRINAAYAQLWIEDKRFEWAGLAAFASKQVGCGLLHSADIARKIGIERDARRRMEKSGKTTIDLPGLKVKRMDEQAVKDWEKARRDNPVPLADIENAGDNASLVQQQLQYVYDRLVLGNTTLFLDIYPMHRFFMLRGWKEFDKCFKWREKSKSRIWLTDQVKFGAAYDRAREGFGLINSSDIIKSIETLAKHEQLNILQPVIYNDPQFHNLLRANHLAYVTELVPGAVQPIAATLSAECRIEPKKTVWFSRNPAADLGDPEQRMPFVLRVAAQFHTMLHDPKHRSGVEAAIRQIATGNAP